MALGGGNWLTQNKKLPGYYHNVISLKRASAELSDRGVAAVPLNLSWGKVGEIFAVERNDFFKNSTKIFGYDYAAPEMWALREVFKHAVKVYCYRLGATDDTGEATDVHQQASCSFATANYPGTRGNSIKIVIENSLEKSGFFIVKTYVGSVCYDAQTVQTYSELVNNDWVSFDKSVATIEASVGIPLAGGTDGTPRSKDYQDFLGAVEPYNYNTLCCPASDSIIVDLFVAFEKSQREDYGVKFQLVAWKAEKADHEGTIGVWNTSEHPDSKISVPEQALVYWVTGAEAGCAINKTLTNMTYDGELKVDVDYTQTELEEAIENGKFMFHNVDGDVRVLEDINTLKTTTDTKGDVFKSNQTMRVADQISNDVAVLFNTGYLGKVQNDKPGRGALWNDVVYYHRQLEKLRAIEDFDPEIITCEIGNTKKSVLLTTNGLNVINAMSQLYMTTVIS